MRSDCSSARRSDSSADSKSSGRVLGKAEKVMARKRNIDSGDIVLDKMIATCIPLTIENYLDLAFMGNPPDNILEDGEFLADLPEVILKNVGR